MGTSIRGSAAEAVVVIALTLLASSSCAFGPAKSPITSPSVEATPSSEGSHVDSQSLEPSDQEPLPVGGDLGKGFQLVILQQDCQEQLLAGATSATRAWAILGHVALEPNALTLSGDDIAAYSWSTQTVSLTGTASARFAGQFSGIDYVDHCFVVVLEGHRLYGGILETTDSQFGVLMPVLYPQRASDHLDLVVRPYNRGTLDITIYSSAEMSTIALPSIRSYFEASGKLRS